MVCHWHRNREISLSSRNNPEMSQRSSDVSMVLKFSIYIYIVRSRRGSYFSVILVISHHLVGNEDILTNNTYDIINDVIMLYPPM